VIIMAKSKKSKKGFSDPWKVLLYPQLAEKSMNMVEVENKLVFIVNKKASRQDVKEAVEKNFDVKVESVNMMISTKNQKKAFVKLHPDHSAADIASRMGML
jgi:large subunit ribosomal protein L23